ncbi:hypothetical protein, partial [Paraburkholderia sp. RL18-085-BIA-A]|uniref:hypothetical protein n=1 Tax=Paraburkholderia sp. RL18-085-BIA-A TaxID=3031633 RepID=UPI0038B80EEF
MHAEAVDRDLRLRRVREHAFIDAIGRDRRAPGCALPAFRRLEQRCGRFPAVAGCFQIRVDPFGAARVPRVTPSCSAAAVTASPGAGRTSSRSVSPGSGGLCTLIRSKAVAATSSSIASS